MSPLRSNDRSGVGWQAAICCAASDCPLSLQRGSSQFRWDRFDRCFPGTAHWRHSPSFSVLQGIARSPLSLLRAPGASLCCADRDLPEPRQPLCLPIGANRQVGPVGIVLVTPMQQHPPNASAFPGRGRAPCLLRKCRTAPEFVRAWPAYRCTGRLSS